MCGFAGFWEWTPTDVDLFETAEKMASLIAHRGPDSSGIWVDETLRLALAHRRLSIVDLSSNGRQPMVSQSNRFVLIYNGELYNTLELRELLIQEGCRFRGYSDTEVIVEACNAWGVRKTTERLNGIFSFVLWDTQEKRIFLVRDRVGVKPLYWGIEKNTLFFGSQLKNFFSHPNWRGEIDRDSLTSYLRFNYVPAPFTIFKNIYKLEPGCLLTFQSDGSYQKESYWDINAFIQKRSINDKNDVEIIEEAETLLLDSVKRQMISDVPLGAFLSGGIDSSLVVALMQKQNSQPIRTFSIGFQEKEYNEAQHATAVAQHLGTVHSVFYLTEKNVLENIPVLPKYFDEPFADVSQIPTFLVSQIAKQDVTVCLSGDGGDELFAGYNRYFLGNSLWHWLERTPKWMKGLGKRTLTAMPHAFWDQLSSCSILKKRISQFKDKLDKVAQILQCDSEKSFYLSLVSANHHPETVVTGGQEKSISFWQDKVDLNFIEYMQKMDLLTYLPDDILTKVDRASMGVSLEVRVPLLDHRLIEFSWQLPMHMKVKNGQGKWLLREILKRYVPQQLTERPKMGFGVPIHQWLRGSLREWAEDLLSEDKLQNQELFNAPLIRKCWEEHVTGQKNWQTFLWGILMFQMWQENWKENIKG